VKAMAALQSHTTTGANHPAMLAAATAFSDPRVEADVATHGRRVQEAPRHCWSSGFRASAPGVGIRGAHGAVLFLLPGRRTFPGARRRGLSAPA
jgi:hypothetical protein